MACGTWSVLKVECNWQYHLDCIEEQHLTQIATVTVALN